MRTLLWKEYRENWKWGVLLLVASAIWHVVSQYENHNRMALFSKDYVAVSAMGFSIGALLLGLMQTVFEAQRDRWAYLRHRAIAPERILFAKAIVGLSLYFVAVLIPLLSLAIWESIPGNVAAPFHWSAPIGGLAAMLSGSAFWFAGALIGIRDVRWYGTRLLPVGLPIAGIAGILGSLESIGWISAMGIGVALGAFAVTVIPMVIATAGAFRNRTGYLSQSRASRWSLALSSAISLWLLTLTALMILAGTLEDLRLSWMWPSRVVTHEFDRHGRLIRLERVINPLDPHRKRILDDGMSVVDSGPGVDPRVSLSDFVPFVMLFHDRSESKRDRSHYRGLQQDGPVRRICDHWGNPQASHWFFEINDGVLLGYHGRTRRLAWRAGPDGIVGADQPMPRPFSGTTMDWSLTSRFDATAYVTGQDRWQLEDPFAASNAIPNWPQPLQTEDGLYWMDRGGPRLTRVYAVDPPDRLVALMIISRKEETVVWMVRDRVIRKYVLAENGRVLAATDLEGHHQLTEDLLRAEFTIPEAVRGIGDFGVAELPEKNLVVYRTVQFVDTISEDRSTVHTILATPQGQVLRHVTSDRDHVYHTRANLFAAPMVPAILAAGLTAMWAPRVEQVSTPGVAIESLASPPSKAFLLVMWVSWLLSLMATGLLVRRFRFPRNSSLGWLSASAMLGPAAPLTLLALRERVPTVICSGCQSRRPRNAECCPHCGQLFPQPARNGTEIFTTLVESKLSQSIAEPVNRDAARGAI